jgi:hypothetical protein
MMDTLLQLLQFTTHQKFQIVPTDSAMCCLSSSMAILVGSEGPVISPILFSAAFDQAVLSVFGQLRFLHPSGGFDPVPDAKLEFEEGRGILCTSPSQTSGNSAELSLHIE